MRKSLLLLFIGFLLTSCLSASPPVPIEKPSVILKDLMSFLVYQQNHLKFFEEFTGLDITGKAISNEVFIKQLGTGKFFPLKCIQQKKVFYRLSPLPKNANKDILLANNSWIATETGFLKMRGQELPNYNFTDLSGKKYSPESTKGKILVIKCWFIGCKPCVAEIPDLNAVVEKYKNRGEVLFIAPAFDKTEALEKFVQKKPFKYAVVGNQEDFMQNKLQIQAYPTHIVVGKDGKIVNVGGTYHAMEYTLARLLK